MFRRKSSRLRLSDPAAVIVGRDRLHPEDGRDGGTAPIAAMTSEHVAHADRLFHGRAPGEGPDATAARAETLGDMLDGLVGSAEFRAWSARTIRDPAGVEHGFRVVPSDELPAWAGRTFATGDDDGGTIAGRSVLALLAAVLARPAPRRALDAAYGDEGGADLTAQLARVAGGAGRRRCAG